MHFHHIYLCMLYMPLERCIEDHICLSYTIIYDICPITFQFYTSYIQRPHIVLESCFDLVLNFTSMYVQFMLFSRVGKYLNA